MSYHLQFERLCTKLRLGHLTAEPIELTGGHLHKVFSLQTDLSRYAVKALNPLVMLRPKAMCSILNSEQIAALLAHKIPAAPALVFHDSVVSEVDGQYYLLFDWIEGKALRYSEITAAHCETVGAILAKIHLTDFGDYHLIDDITFDEPVVDWARYLQMGENCGSIWTGLLRENIDDLYHWSSLLHDSSNAESVRTVISHGDLEPKNVLWKDGTPIIIDWEAAGAVDPLHDLIETAIYWSKSETDCIDKEKFLTFIRAYKHVYGPVHADWLIVLHKGFTNLSGWLEYSLKRSLMIECNDKSEQQIGTEHVIGTINAAKKYFDMVPILNEWLCSI